MSLLRVENISSGYGKKEVINNISFNIEEGEVVTLIGSNGAGKSTILKTIYGLNPIWNEGKVFFDNVDISNIKPDILIQKGMVYISQKNNTFNTLSIIENLKTAGYIYDKNILSIKIEQIFILFPKLKDMSDKKPIELSGGEKQLLALAMGLIHEPKLILFDEPSAGLDVRNMNEVFSIIKQLRQDRSISFLIVEHRIKEIEKISDNFIGLKLGKKTFDISNLNDNKLKELFL